MYYVKWPQSTLVRNFYPCDDAWAESLPGASAQALRCPPKVFKAHTYIYIYTHICTYIFSKISRVHKIFVESTAESLLGASAQALRCPSRVFKAHGYIYRSPPSLDIPKREILGSQLGTYSTEHIPEFLLWAFCTNSSISILTFLSEKSPTKYTVSIPAGPNHFAAHCNTLQHSVPRIRCRQLFDVHLDILNGELSGVLQCVAVCCSVLQCVAVCCSVSQCVAVCRSVLQCVAVCCRQLFDFNLDILNGEILKKKWVTIYSICPTTIYGWRITHMDD